MEASRSSAPRVIRMPPSVFTPNGKAKPRPTNEGTPGSGALARVLANTPLGAASIVRRACSACNRADGAGTRAPRACPSPARFRPPSVARRPVSGRPGLVVGWLRHVSVPQLI